MKLETLEDLRDWHMEQAKFYAKLNTESYAQSLSESAVSSSMMHFGAAEIIGRHLAEFGRPDGMVLYRPQYKDYTKDQVPESYETVTNSTFTPVDIPGEINKELL